MQPQVILMSWSRWMTLLPLSLFLVMIPVHAIASPSAASIEATQARLRELTDAQERARQAEAEVNRLRTMMAAQRQELERAQAEHRAAQERLRHVEEEAAQTRRQARRLRTSGWLAVGAGVVGILAAGTFGTLARHELSKRNRVTSLRSQH